MSDYSRGIRVGCVAVIGNKVISTGFNTDRTHPVQMKYNAYRTFTETAKEPIGHKLHAEIACLAPLIGTDINWSKVSLYIYRIRCVTPCGNARPCPACMQLIKDLGIKNIYYTTDDEKRNYAYENTNAYADTVKRSKFVSNELLG